MDFQKDKKNIIVQKILTNIQLVRKIWYILWQNKVQLQDAT